MNAHCREGICCTFLIPIGPSLSANHRVWPLNAVEPLQAVYTCREEHKHQSSCVSDCLPLIVYANMFRHTNTAHTYTQQINTHNTYCVSVIHTDTLLVHKVLCYLAPLEKSSEIE